jgi:hypothetical protein
METSGSGERRRFAAPGKSVAQACAARNAALAGAAIRPT